MHYNPTVKIDFEIMLNKISELEKVLSFSNASPRLEEGGLSKMSDSSPLPPSPLCLHHQKLQQWKTFTELSVLVSYLFLKELK